MDKSTFFSGQPIFGQLLDLIPDSLIATLVQKHQSDRYYKTFKSRDHLVAMLYSCFQQCTSLREISTGLAASTVAPGSTPPEASRTMPVIAACA